MEWEKLIFKSLNLMKYTENIRKRAKRGIADFFSKDYFKTICKVLKNVN